MKTFFAFLFALTVIVAQADPVRVEFDSLVNRGDLAYSAATINYIYIDSDHLDVFTSIGNVRMCYPPSSVPVDSIAAVEFYAARAQACPVEFSVEEVMQSAFVFIKQTVPAKFKAWAQTGGQ